MTEARRLRQPAGDLRFEPGMPPAQLSLFGREEPEFDADFRELRRVDLGRGAWIELASGWLGGHSRLFEQLASGTRWRAEQREMYERVVEVPRLYAVLPQDGAVPPVLREVQAALSQRYREEFCRLSLGYYRDGRDSVAWHGDYVARRLDTAVVATVSVGAPRRFLLRPTGGGPSLRFSLGFGDLFVMGGTCQRTYQHCVPKLAHADPRIAVMFRPQWEEPRG